MCNVWCDGDVHAVLDLSDCDDDSLLEECLTGRFTVRHPEVFVDHFDVEVGEWVEVLSVKRAREVDPASLPIYPKFPNYIHPVIAQLKKVGT